MTTGTIGLTWSSNAVSGSGTKFTSELSVGDFIYVTVSGVNYTLGISGIASDTSITLAAPYVGDTASGLSFSAIPSGAMVGITSQIAADTSRAIRGLNADKQNWQNVLSGTGTVTVTLPDGSTYSGPAWGGISTSLEAKANSSDLNNYAKTSALGNLAYLSQATRDNLNSELFRNLFACGGIAANSQGAGVYTFNNTPWGFGAQYGVCAQFSNQTSVSGQAGSGIWQHYLAMSTSGDILYVTNINGSYSARKLYSTSNTTTNSSGALVPASPIVRVVNSVADNTRQDVIGTTDEYSQQSDYGYTNAESDGCEITKTGTGTYLITGATGLATDLWSVMDCGNGQGRIIALAAATETEQGVQVQCFKQKYTLSDSGDLEVTKGDLIDIPNDTWIDVRLQMPADSIWNKATAQGMIVPGS